MRKLWLVPIIAIVIGLVGTDSALRIAEYRYWRRK